MKRILVTGASGFIGKKLVESLAKKGYNVRCLLRETSTGIKFMHNLEIIQGDIRNPEEIEGICNGIQTVFHLAACQKGRKEEQEKTNINGTRNLLEEAVKSKVRHFIYLSSFSVFGIIKNRASPSIDQEHKPFTVYAKSKYAAERLCFEYSKKYKLKTLIVRPPMVYDYEEPTNDLKLITWFVKRRLVPVIGSGENKINMISRSKLIEKCISLALEKKEGIILAHDETITYNQLVSRVMSYHRINFILRIYLPFFILYLAVFILKNIFNLFNLTPPMTPERLNMIRNS